MNTRILIFFLIKFLHELLKTFTVLAMVCFVICLYTYLSSHMFNIYIYIYMCVCVCVCVCVCIKEDNPENSIDKFCQKYCFFIN